MKPSTSRTCHWQKLRRLRELTKRKKAQTENSGASVGAPRSVARGGRNIGAGSEIRSMMEEIEVNLRVIIVIIEGAGAGAGVVVVKIPRLLPRPHSPRPHQVDPIDTSAKGMS